MRTHTVYFNALMAEEDKEASTEMYNPTTTTTLPTATTPSITPLWQNNDSMEYCL
jgi:hypothetical protein